MSRRLISLVFPVVLVLVLALTAQADPLFESDDTLAFELHGPFRTMESERDKEVEYPGEVRLGGKTFTVKLSLRGNRRLDKTVCDYPPLRVNFKKSEVDDTVFDKQDDIKLVVQCDNGSRYADYLRTEFLIYRAFNLLTPSNYHVRWVQVTYVDSDNGKTRTDPAFMVERKSRLAKRLNLRTTDIVRARVSELDPDQGALVSLFQFVIANPDFSLTAAPPGEECCHNAKLLVLPNGKHLPVIYDFDSTGLVDARYAVPPDGLGIRSVTQRLYRGYCEHNAALPGARKKILDRSRAIIQLFAEDPILSERERKSTTRFLESSFETLSEDKDFDRQIVSRCRG